MQKDKSQSYSKKETVIRRDEALRRALNTPPKPHKNLGKKPEPDEPKPDKSS